MRTCWVPGGRLTMTASTKQLGDRQNQALLGFPTCGGLKCSLPDYSLLSNPLQVSADTDLAHSADTDLAQSSPGPPGEDWPSATAHGTPHLSLKPVSQPTPHIRTTECLMLISPTRLEIARGGNCPPSSLPSAPGTLSVHSGLSRVQGLRPGLRNPRTRLCPTPPSSWTSQSL